MRGNTYEEVRRERMADSKAEGDRYRNLSNNPNRLISPSWWIIDSPEVEQAVRQAARKVARKFGETFEVEDLEADAWLAASRIAHRAKECLENNGNGDMGTFQYELECDMLDLLRPIYGRHHLTSPDPTVGTEVEVTGRPTRLFDKIGDHRGGSDAEWFDDWAEVA